MRFVQYIRFWLLLRDLWVKLCPRNSNRERLDYSSGTVRESLSASGTITMEHKDCFWERAVLREFFLSKPLDQAIALLAPFMVEAYKTAMGGQLEARDRLFDQIQDNLIDRYLLKRWYPVAKKREFHREWTFARIELTKEQKDDFTKFQADEAIDPMELLTIAMEEGYKFSATYRQDKGHWMATLSGTEASPYNDRVSLTAFHQTLDLAIAVLMFKHVVVAGQKQWPSQSSMDDWG